MCFESIADVKTHHHDALPYPKTLLILEAAASEVPQERPSKARLSISEYDDGLPMAEIRHCWEYHG